jgi:hypothetical protein
MLHRIATLSLALAPALAIPLGAQGTLDDYRRAATVNQIYAGKTVGLVQTPTWFAPGQAWYRVSVTGGNRFVLVDAEAFTKQPAFDHARLAAALSTVANAQYTEITLPFTGFAYANNRQAVDVDVAGARWRCTLTTYACTKSDTTAAAGAAAGRGRGADAGRGGRGAAGGRGRGDAGGRGGAAAAPAGRGGQGGGGNNGRLSPDGRWEAVVQNFNVGLRPAGQAGAPVTMLSTDGVAGDSYQLMSVSWAPDSKKFVAYRQKPGAVQTTVNRANASGQPLKPGDTVVIGTEKHVTYVMSSPSGISAQSDTFQPRTVIGPLYRKPGDVLAVTRPVLFDVETRKQTIVDNRLFPNAYQISRGQWWSDSRGFSFEYNQRGHMVYRVIEVNGATGQPRALINEETKSFFQYRAVNPGLTDAGHYYRRDLDGGKEIIWSSERDGWAHLYLYDGITGQVKNQITKGNWVVKAIDSVDTEKRQIYFSALGMNAGQDPYFLHYYRVNFDGTNLVKYTEGNGTHTITWSPDRRFYFDSYSRVDMPPVVELRRASDLRMLPLEKGDMSAALATGWKPPEVFVAKARDGVTDIWGIIVRPQTFDPNKKYPVIEQIYAGPQGSFVPKSWGGGQGLLATAELGFVMVQIDGMGTANRSKAFHDVAWKNLADAGFPDRILWMKAAAAKYPWFDATRVGLYGGSAGGQNAAGAVLLHSDFYDAAFASSGCHDNRMDKIWWNELWMGEVGPHYAANSNVTHAANLKGHLFLAVGEYDTNVDPSSTMQVVDALVRAGKDFDLLVVPNGGHGATGSTGTRKRNDFFVRHLMGVNPPDWNSGITVGGGGRGRGGPGAPSTMTLGDLIQFPAAEPPPYGFFENPADDKPPYWWW